MIEFNCPGCQSRLQASYAQAGKTLRCGNCQFPVLVPSTSPPVRSPAPLPIVDAEVESDFKGEPFVPSEPAEPREREPWFFHFVAFFAYLILLFALSVFGVTLVVALAGTIYYLYQTGSWNVAVASILAVVYVFFWTLPIIFGSSAILLVLDMARSFRCLRVIARNTSPKTR